MKRDLWAGLIMMALALLLMLVLIPVGVVEPKKVKYAALSPSYYPRFVTYVLLALGIAITARSLLFKEAGVVSDDLRPDATRRYCWVFVILAVYAASVTWLGFIVTSTLALLATFWLAGERRWYLIIPIALSLPLGLYFFFLKVASVPIPLGILEPWLAGV
jgi:hypothetical protein